MNKRLLFVIIIGLLGLVGLYQHSVSAAVASQIVDMQAQINAVMGLTIVSSDTMPIGSVVPAGTWDSHSPGVTANYWNIVSPLKVTFAIQNNNPSTTLYVYTDHQREDYWSDAVRGRLSASSSIDGLVNVDSITAQNWYKATAALRVWPDVYNEGQVTTNATANWVWVTDKKGAPLFTQSASRQVLLSDSQLMLNQNLDMYIRSAWSAPKVAGTYKGRVRFTLEAQ